MVSPSAFPRYDYEIGLCVARDPEENFQVAQAPSIQIPNLGTNQSSYETTTVPASCLSICPTNYKTVQIPPEEKAVFATATTQKRSAILYETDPEYIFVREYIDYAQRLVTTGIISSLDDKSQLIKSFIVPRLCVHLGKKAEILRELQKRGKITFQQKPPDHLYGPGVNPGSYTRTDLSTSGGVDNLYGNVSIDYYCEAGLAAEKYENVCSLALNYSNQEVWQTEQAYESDHLKGIPPIVTSTMLFIENWGKLAALSAVEATGSGKPISPDPGGIKMDEKRKFHVTPSARGGTYAAIASISGTFAKNAQARIAWERNYENNKEAVQKEFDTLLAQFRDYAYFVPALPYDVVHSCQPDLCVDFEMRAGVLVQEEALESLPLPSGIKSYGVEAQTRSYNRWSSVDAQVSEYDTPIFQVIDACKESGTVATRGGVQVYTCFTGMIPFFASVQPKIRQAMASGDHSLALEYLDAALAREQHPAFHNDRAIVLSEMKKNDEALTAINKAIALDPRCANHYSTRGSIYNDLGNYEKALDDFKKAHEMDPRDPDFANFYATAYNGLGVKQLTAAQKSKKPERIIADSTSAIGNITQAIKLAPSDQTARENLGVAYLTRAQQQLSGENYEEALKDIRRGLVYVKGEENVRALKNVQAVVYNDRAIRWANQKKYDLAIQDLEQCLGVDPKNTGCQENLNSVRAHRSPPSLTTVPLKAEIADGGTSQADDIEIKIDRLNERGIAFFKAGNFSKAVKIFEEALKMDSNRPNIKKNLALAFNSLGVESSKKGNLKAAVEYYEKSIQHNPEDEIMKKNLAVAYHNVAVKICNQDYEKAVSFFEKALKLEPKDGQIWHNLGICHSNNGHPQEAKAAQEKAKSFGKNKNRKSP